MVKEYFKMIKNNLWITKKVNYRISNTRYIVSNFLSCYYLDSIMQIK